MFYKRVGAFLANLVALIVSFVMTYVLRFGWEPDEPAFRNVNESMVLAFLILSFLVVFTFYRPRPNNERWGGSLKLLKDSFLTVVFMAAVFSTFVYTSHVNDAIPRMFFAYFFVIDFILTFLLTAGSQLIEKGIRKRHTRKTVIVTDIKDRTKIIRQLMKEGRDDLEVVGVIALHETRKSDYYIVKTISEVQHKIPNAGLFAVNPDLLKFEFEKADMDSLTFLKRHQIDQVVIMVDRWDREKLREMIDEIAEMGIETMVTLDSFAMNSYESKLEDYGTVQVLRIAPRIFSDGELVIKRVMDILGSLVGCLVCLIAGIFVAPLIFICDPGPIIFKQKRVGKNGKYFYIYKFRSMYKDAEARLKDLQSQNEMEGMMFKMKNDPRITKIGKILRKTSIDELPQFFNVLRGDMSLVGTRPPTVDEYKQYSRHHKRRLTLKPGITGLWQVSGRSEITDFEEIVRLDCYYIDHWSVLYDIKILIMTVGAVFTGKGSE